MRDWEYEKLEELKEEQIKKSFTCVKDGKSYCIFYQFYWNEKVEREII
jgi:hypothetical protein